MHADRLGLGVLCLAVAAILLALTPVVGEVRLTESAVPESPSAGQRLTVTLVGMVWIAALGVLTLATLRNARVALELRAGSRFSMLNTLLALAIVFVLVKLLSLLKREGDILHFNLTGGVRFNPPEWLPRLEGPGAPEAPVAGPAALANRLSTILLLAAGLAVLIVGLILLLKPGVSIFPGLGRWAWEKLESPGEGEAGPPSRPKRRWEGIRMVVIESYRDAVTTLASRGLPSKPSWTHTEHLAFVERTGRPEARPLSELTRLFEVARYSRRPLSEAAAREAKRLSREVRECAEE